MNKLDSLFFYSAFKNKRLILRMAKREISSRYKGSMLGFFWSLLNPLIMLTVYTFVFSVVFDTKWGGGAGENFSIILFTGLILHALVAESVVVAPSMVLNNVNYVKKVVFPIEILAFVYLSRSFFNFVIGLCLVFVAQLLFGTGVSLTWFYMPLIVLPALFLCLIIFWLFSSLGVYVRDLGQITPVLATLLLFLCPIFYPLSAMHGTFQKIILLNPLSYLVEQAREIFIFGNAPNILNLSIYTLATIVLAQLAFNFFMKTKKGFADVL